jgi:hypothetical protein
VRDLVPLRHPLLCEADVAVQCFGILQFPLAALLVLRLGFLHDVVDPLFRHHLRQELCVVGNVQELHLLCHHASEEILRKRLVFWCDISLRIFSATRLVCQRARLSLCPSLPLSIAKK